MSSPIVQSLSSTAVSFTIRENCMYSHSIVASLSLILISQRSSCAQSVLQQTRMKLNARSFYVSGVVLVVHCRKTVHALVRRVALSTDVKNFVSFFCGFASRTLLRVEAAAKRGMILDVDAVSGPSLHFVFGSRVSVELSD